MYGIGRVASGRKTEQLSRIAPGAAIESRVRDEDRVVAKESFFKCAAFGGLLLQIFRLPNNVKVCPQVQPRAI